MTEPLVTDEDVERLAEAFEWDHPIHPVRQLSVKKIVTEIVERENKPLLEALVHCAIPYEALLMNGESKRWIERGIWESIQKAVAAARREVKKAKSREANPNG